MLTEFTNNRQCTQRSCHIMKMEFARNIGVAINSAQVNRRNWKIKIKKNRLLKSGI